MATAYVAPTNGIVGSYTGGSTIILRAMTAFSAIAWYNSIEIMIMVLLRFKRYSGLYFWSLMITSFSIIVYQIGAWGKMVNLIRPQMISQVLSNIGWLFMISGQSMVLYSRLHLITQNRRLLRAVLWGIIINTLLMYIPTTALTYGTMVSTTLKNHEDYVNGYAIMERIQMTFFSVQEFIISGVYMLEASRFLRVVSGHEVGTRRILFELLAVNIALIALDVALLGVEFEDLFEIETTLKGMVYSIKLKLELGVLSRMVKMVTSSQDSQKTGASLEQGDSNALARYSTAKTTATASSWLARRASAAVFANPAGKGVVADTRGTGHPSAPLEAMEFQTAVDPAVADAVDSADEEAQKRGRLELPPADRPNPSRDSSITNLYPGRIVGD